MTAIHEHAELRQVAPRLSEETGQAVKLPSYDQVRRAVHRLKSEPDLVALREGAPTLPRARQSPHSFALSIPVPALLTQVDEHNMELYVVTPEGVAVTERIHAVVLVCVKTAAILSAILALGPFKEEDYMRSLADHHRASAALRASAKGTVEAIFRWMTQRFERRMPNTSYGVHDAQEAALAGGLTLEALERAFVQAIVDDYQQAWDPLQRQRRSVLWDQTVAETGVPRYLGAPDDLKLLLMKAVNRKRTDGRCQVQAGARLSFQGR
jgi:hypothetical protein